MAAAAKTAVLGVLAVAVAVIAGIGARPTESAVAEPVSSGAPVPSAPAPSVRAAPEPTWTPTDPTTLASKTRFYTTGRVPAVSCRLPKTLVQTRAGMLAYARTMVGCMQRAWRPAVLKTGFLLYAPDVEAYSLDKPAATPLCRNPPRNTDAYYLSSNRLICFEWPSFVDGEDPVWNLIAFQTVVAHEFGHHLQQTVDILSTYEFAHAGGSAAVQLEDERRLELQASCLGAAFLGAHKQSLKLTGQRLDMWEYQVAHTGDEYNPQKIRDHGSRKNHGYWSQRAFDSKNPSSCNTFVAPAKRVS
ncbi:hypothetical protein E0H75_30470 [Kribbella capetownensis]|uniref:Metalloprotease n=1 Tax=Kribbella capetownensis TaxID=1572659 RepID=A0A4R0JIG1_9ACTN|nr:neutral zinc metallopeptidase [Kribbella capetownensis]TCC46027.1 hypothetical protein E0H75_30470 [Kribbella capetownensis]